MDRELDPQTLRNLQTFVPTNDTELWRLVKFLWNVEIPHKKVCENHSAPFTAFSEAFFRKKPISAWIGSRGFSGKSLLLAVLGLTEQVVLGASVLIAGGSGEQAERVHAYVTGKDPVVDNMFWNAPYAPRWMQTGDPLKRESRTINGGLLKTITASQRSVRGNHQPRLRIDEVDELDLDLYDALLGSPDRAAVSLPGGPYVLPRCAG
jgi:hypothetical protein